MFGAQLAHGAIEPKSRPMVHVEVSHVAMVVVVVFLRLLFVEYLAFSIRGKGCSKNAPSYFGERIGGKSKSRIA